MSTALILLTVAVAMALQDFFGTMMTVAEVRGRGKLAGLMDASGDMARFIGNVYGAGTAIKYGWTPLAAATLVVMAITSYFGTAYWTKLSRRIKEQAVENVVEKVETK